MLLISKNITKIFIFTNFFFLNLSPIFGKCIYKNCLIESDNKTAVKLSKRNLLVKSSENSNPSLLALKIQTLDKTTLKRVIIEDNVRLDELLDSFIASAEKSDLQEQLAVEIESDNQYQENDIYYAEGNVIIKLTNGTIKADKFSYDRKNGKAKLIDNVSFKKGNQYLKSTLIIYDFNLKKGEINNVSGILSINNLGEDLNLYDIDRSACKKEELDLLEIPRELELLNTKNTRLDNIYGLTSDFGSISNWGFKSEKILVENNSWKTDYIEFTNDPFEKPQFILESKDFVAEISGNSYKFTSKSTYLNFENKLRIPIGNRTIKDTDASPKWGVGYDPGNWDGLYLYRSSDIFELTNNLNFSFKPFFLVQRAIRGKTNSFRFKDSSFVDDKVLQRISYSDYLGLEADIKGKIFNWNSDLKFTLRSLNQQRLDDSFSIDANITNTLYSSSNKNAKDSCKIQNQNPIKNFSVTSGFYGAFLKDNIYSAYGTKLITEYSFEGEKIKDKYSLILDAGNYKGKSSTAKSFLSLERYGINANFNRSYRLFDLNKGNLVYGNEYNKTPVIIDKAFFLNTKLSSSAYQYSNKKSQSIFLAGIGPSFTLGNLKNDFLDYSYISIMPEFIIKKGKSPFTFDDFNSHSRIKFIYSQQIYGPILFGLSSDFIISNKSNNYGEFTNNKYTLEISRRAYKISLFYKNDQSFGLNFNIFNFESRLW